MKQNILILYFIIFLSFIIPLEAHHTGMGGSDQSSTRFVDPFTGKREKPANYVILTQDFFKQTNENSNIHTSTFFGEINLKNGMFALNLSVPYTYYEQKDRSDAARIGKTYIGIKYLPLVDFQKNYFIVFSANVGFPSGPDTDKFTGGNYYSGIPGLTFGYLLGKFSFVGKVSGIFPLSKLQPSNLQDNDGIVYWLRNPSSSPPEETYLLKKTSLFSGYVTYLWKPGLSFFTGFLYRTPYEGVDLKRSNQGKVPSIFREVSLGFSANISEKLNFNLSYRHPLYRGEDYRLYDYAITAAVSIEISELENSKPVKLEEVKQEPEETTQETK
ncbi:transporter [Leptospira kirschneri]|uniref:LIC11086 family outer membrane transporter n=1 Tax=Leptospira kirschneri TaxID=29507 RepID=UPI002260F7C1|nr:transporter [Leptospira kirschneri]UZW35307.1 transporter [Leptospira kirschneri]WHO99014.1 transporter [Leptospira kirschneri]